MTCLCSPYSSDGLQLLAVDRSTELSNEALRTMRATYAERMQVEREKAEQRKDENDAHQRAMDLVFGPPAFSTSFSSSLAVLHAADSIHDCSASSRPRILSVDYRLNLVHPIGKSLTVCTPVQSGRRQFRIRWRHLKAAGLRVRPPRPARPSQADTRGLHTQTRRSAVLPVSHRPSASRSAPPRRQKWRAKLETASASNLLARTQRPISSKRHRTCMLVANSAEGDTVSFCFARAKRQL